MIYYKRLDRVVAIRTTPHVTEGKIYTVLGVKRHHLLIATDKHKRIYLQSDLFLPEDIYCNRVNSEIEQKLEDRGF